MTEVEIEVTPEMIEAGQDALHPHKRRFTTHTAACCEDIFRAMAAISPRSTQG